MAKFILGRKLEMTQIFTEDGRVIPVTKVLAGPCFVTYIKTKEKDGYDAIQVGYLPAKKISKSVKGHLKNLGPFKYIKEFRQDGKVNLKIGQEIKAEVFAANDIVDVSGVTKGKGFQGVVKRWNFGGSPKTHGHKDQSRMPGASGAGGEQHVKKGKKMGGRMGGENQTIKNLQIVRVDDKNNLLFIKGAVPGRPNNLILVYGQGEMKLADEPTLPGGITSQEEPQVKIQEEIKA